MNLAPIILFVYKRPKLTQKVLTALSQNNLAKDSVLYIYADGPKINSPEKERQNIHKTREILRKKKWCKEVHLIESSVNIGCDNSIINGVSQICEKHGKVIVLEDDIVTSKYFLQYMNDALNLYEKEDKVLSIGAMNYFANDNEVDETFFCPIPDCWGWATWKNRWDLFERDGKKLLKQLKEKDLIPAFNLEGAYDFEQMLMYQIEGLIDAWDIRWQALAYVLNKITLYPKYSVTKNIGFNIDSTHVGEDVFNHLLKFCNKKIELKPKSLMVKEENLKRLINCFENMKRPKNKNSALNNIRRIAKNLTPPTIYSKYFQKTVPKEQKWIGVYESWNDALKNSNLGSISTLLPEMARKRKLVKEGLFPLERDNAIIKDLQQNWALLSCLQKVYSDNGDKLYVLDFFGGLGSNYQEYILGLSTLTNLKWIVFDQSDFVEKGKKDFETEQLKFEDNIDKILSDYPINCLFISGSLQYLSDAKSYIQKINNLPINSIIMDRLALINREHSIITVQQKFKNIDQLSHPFWFFESNFVKNNFSNYQIITQFKSFCDKDYIHEEGYCTWQGYYLKK